MPRGESGSSNRGFGAKSSKEQKEIASKGGKVSHHGGGREKVGAGSGSRSGGQFTSETAREAGRKGGKK